MTTASNNPGITNDLSLQGKTTVSTNQEMMIVNSVRLKKAAIKEKAREDLLRAEEEGFAEFRVMEAASINALVVAADRIGMSRYKAYKALAPAFSANAPVETPLSPVNAAAPDSQARALSPVGTGASFNARQSIDPAAAGAEGGKP